MFAIVSAVATAQQAPFRLPPPSPPANVSVVMSANYDPDPRTNEQIYAANLKLAQAGDLYAALQLGLAYMQGRGVAKNASEAELWLVKSAVSPQSKNRLATFYERGYLPQDATKAEYWYRSAGRPEDLFSLAKMFASAIPSQVDSAAVIYMDLLKQPGPYARQAQLGLGNLVLDSHFSEGDSPQAHADNLSWARAIAQEMVGQQEYTIAIAYNSPVNGLPKDNDMWLRFCRRAAAYNIDLAQEYYGKAIADGKVQRVSPLEGDAWSRLASDKQFNSRRDLALLEQSMSAEQLREATSIFDGLIATHKSDGAYYPAGDPLREPNVTTLAAMADDDPDVQLRRAFNLESSNAKGDYEKALGLYRIARDRRDMDSLVVLGRDYLLGDHGVQPDARLSKYWLNSAAKRGSHPAALYLARWYRGEGGGTADPVEARAWELIGTEPAGTAKAPASLSADQVTQSSQIYADWLKRHPVWEVPPSQAHN